MKATEQYFAMHGAVCFDFFTNRNFSKILHLGFRSWFFFGFKGSAKLAFAVNKQERGPERSENCYVII